MTRSSADPASRLAASGVLDLEFYQALRGRTWADDALAAADFVAWAMPQGVQPHPGVDMASLPKLVRGAWRRGRPKPLLDHLQAAPPPVLTPADRMKLVEIARRVGSADPVAVDWSAVAARELDRVPGRVSVIVTVEGDRAEASSAVGSVLEHAAGPFLEVIVVDHGLPVADALSLAAELVPRGVEVVRVPAGDGGSVARNLGIAHASGEYVVFLDPSCLVRDGWLDPMVAALRDPRVAGVQPLLVNDDETIATAGLGILASGRVPTPLLRGHQRDDALGLADERLVAVSGAAMAVRAADLIVEEGFDREYASGLGDIDLCLRMGLLRGRHFRVLSQVVVTQRTVEAWPEVDRARFLDRWRNRLPAPDPEVYGRLGLHVDRIEPDGGRVPVVRAVLGRYPDRPDDQLRWSIKLPSTRGHWGDRWGDTHFANALARALRGLDQQVVTCRQGAHDAGPAYLDDVSLAIRGRHPVAPVPGKTNVLWVISHPDDVDPDEFEGYDLVFAASPYWSRMMSDRSGHEVRPLLQASEFASATPALLPPAAEREMVFVGSTHDGRHRLLVEQAVESRVGLAVYGAGWEGLVPSHQWKAEYVANESLPDLYRRHGIVLADHWPDMARHGFIANRVFDAIAAGARVICDDVVGVHDVFSTAEVAVCRSPAEIRAVVEAWPEASLVQGEHDVSFANRAESLVTAVLASRSGGRVTPKA